MQTELSDHPFSPENVAIETGASNRGERAWFKFCDDCEKLLGHELDGNDSAEAQAASKGEGFSIDEAYDRFGSMMTAAQYVAIIRGRERYAVFCKNFGHSPV